MRRVFVFTILLAVCCSSYCQYTVAANLKINASIDGTARDEGRDGTFEQLKPSPMSLGVINSARADVEIRAMAEFNLATLPDNAIIDTAAFGFRTIGIGSFQIAFAFIDGYVGDGTITLADATVAAVQLASYDVMALGAGVHAVSIPPELVQSLIAGNGFLGIRLSVSEDGDTTLAGVDGTIQPPPNLQLTYHVPEPSTVALAAFGLLALVGVALRGSAVWRS